MSVRMTTTNLRRMIENINEELGTNFTIECYRPGSQTLCRLDIETESGGIMPVLQRYFTPTELYHIIDAIYNIRNLKQRGLLKGNIC